MANDSQFLAAAHAAVAIVDLFGSLPGKRKAESIGLLTFMLLDLLKEQERGAYGMVQA